jgi:hypothetical protein
VADLVVHGLPDEVYAALRRRAEASGQTLHDHLVEELTRLAAQPTVDEVLDRVGGRRGGRVGLREAAADLAKERRRR